MKKTIFAILVIMLVACQPTPEPYVPDVKLEPGTYEEVEFDLKAPVNTNTFESEEALISFIRDHESSSNYYGGGFRGDVVMVESMAMDAAEGVPTPSVKAGADYSETNVQVQGVDEADIIKTDGEYIYTTSGKNLHIIKAYPGEDAEIVSTIKFDSNPSGLFISGDKLAVFGNFYDDRYWEKIDYFPRSGMSYYQIYDLSDKEKPKLEKDFKFDGRYFRARMIGDEVFFITTSSPSVGIPRPLIIEDDVRIMTPVADIYYFDVPYNSPSYANINKIDFDGEYESKTIVIESSQNMYMSHDNIYITYTQWINEHDIQIDVMKELLASRLTEKDIELIEKIKKTDNDVLSKHEKEQKILQVYLNVAEKLTSEEEDDLEKQAELLMEKKLKEYEYFEYTVINKVNTNLEIEANGKVPGSIINQFAMDEYEDNLRIATTVNRRWSRFDSERDESNNNVFVLDEDLDIIGSLKGLAETESIFSTRFVGDKLYMVTFRQVDPFFVIDLSNPRNPKELGQLKIPGFSRYLHPYDENTLIGIGQDATNEGRTQGLKVSLFDVSDVTKPKEVAKFVTDEKYARSSALWEHKAFLFSKEKELMVIPAYSYGWGDNRGDRYNGAFVFKITKDEITLRGLVDHSPLVFGNEFTNEYWYSPQVERSLYIEELLYTKSPNLLRINEIDDLGSVKNIKLTTTKIDVY